MTYARTIRSEVLRLTEMDFVRLRGRPGQTAAYHRAAHLA